jgi:hypothetical protein
MTDTWGRRQEGPRWRVFGGVLAVLAGAAVLAQLAGGPAPSAADENKAGDGSALPADLARVPSNSAGFLSLRLAELWEQESARQLREQFKGQLPAAMEEWQQLVGLAPADIERLTVVSLVFPPSQYPLFFVGTAQPYDKTKVLAAVGPKVTEEKRNDHTLYVGPRNNAIHFINDRAYVASSVEEIRQLLERPAPKKEGPLAEALPLAAGKHAAVLGLNAGPIIDQVPGELPPQAEPFKPLLKTQLATLTLDLKGGLGGDLRITFADEKEAKGGKEAVQSVLNLARMGLGLAAQQVQKDKDAAKLGELLGRAQADLEDTKIKVQGSRVEVSAHVKADLAAGGSVLAQAVLKVRGSAKRAQSTNNLKQLALAMHNYHGTNRHFPAQAVYSPDGKPLLSWRVLILPYIEHEDLYKQFHLDEPWDSAHNKKLLAKMPKTYLLPGMDEKSTETHYLGFSGPGAFFDGKKGIGIAEITDGTSNTIMLVEAAKGVPWSKPEDLPFDRDKALPKTAAHFGGGFNAAFCDGSIHFLSQGIREENLKMLITRSGGEVLPPDCDK